MCLSIVSFNIIRIHHLKDFSLTSMQFKIIYNLLKCNVLIPVCPSGYFGLNCTYRCYCRDPLDFCDPVFGNCSSGCPTGWYGPGCVAGEQLPLDVPQDDMDLDV